MIKKINKYLKLIFIYLIKLYQISISPLLGLNCRYIPTCSNYTIEVIQKYGIIKGTWVAFRRILRCQPFGSSGYDSIPD